MKLIIIKPKDVWVIEDVNITDSFKTMNTYFKAARLLQTGADGIF